MANTSELLVEFNVCKVLVIHHVKFLERRVTAVDGQYQIGIYTVREIQYGEEITFDYNSVTEVHVFCLSVLFTIHMHAHTHIYIFPIPCLAIDDCSSNCRVRKNMKHLFVCVVAKFVGAAT